MSERYKDPSLSITERITPLYHYQRNASHPKTGHLNAGLYIDRKGYLARPFGYGLSYTRFDYSNLILSASEDEVPVISISVVIWHRAYLMKCQVRLKLIIQKEIFLQKQNSVS